MASVRFQVIQNELKTISNPAHITAIGGDNATEFNIFFPYMLPGQQWVFPFTYGFMYLVDTPSYVPVRIDASQTPPGGQAPPTTNKIAQLAAHDGIQMFSPGIQASAGTLRRWQLKAAPAAGSQATATRAAASTVSHVMDFFHFNMVAQASAVAANPGVNVIDGVSGGATTFFSSNDGSSATVGSNAIVFGGPGLSYRGTPGTAMTLEFGAGVANYVQTVNGNGYDQ